MGSPVGHRGERWGRRGSRREGGDVLRRGGTGSWWRKSHHRQHLGLGGRQLAADGRDCPRYPPDGVRLAHRPTIGGFRGGRVHRWSQRQLRVQLCRRTGLPGTLAHVLNAAHRPACRNHTYPDTVNASIPNMPIRYNRFGPASQVRTWNRCWPCKRSPTILCKIRVKTRCMLPDLEGVLRNGALLGLDFLNDYNPLVTGSFLYWGAPTLYSVPALLAGLVQNITGIPNQFIETPQWQGEIDPSAPGGVASAGRTPGRRTLARWICFHSIMACRRGSITWCGVYSDTWTPPHTSGLAWGTRLLRTYADGSLPGSDIARLLEGVGIPALLDGVGLGGLRSVRSRHDALRPAGRRFDDDRVGQDGAACAAADRFHDPNRTAVSKVRARMHRRRRSARVRS